MLPVPTKNATHALSAPRNWDEATMGKCGVLSVRVQGGQGGTTESVSTWKPSLEEIGMLQDGGVVILTIVGWQPAVSLHVELEADANSKAAALMSRPGDPVRAG